MPDDTRGAPGSVQGTDGSSSNAFLREVAAISELGTGDVLAATRLNTGEVLSGRFAIERLAGKGGMALAKEWLGDEPPTG